MHRTIVVLGATLVSSWLGACATYRDPGFYSATDMGGVEHPAYELQVGVRPFVAGPGSELSGKELGGQGRPAAERLTNSFLRDLKALGLFARVAMAGAQDDLVIEGEILKLHQDRTWSGFYLGPLFLSYYMMGLFGIPTDCAEAEANLVVRAREIRSGKVVGQWQGAATRSGCAGFYYDTWPLNEALQAASKQLLAGMVGDGGALVQKVARMRSGGEVEPPPARRDESRPPAAGTVMAVFDIQDASGSLDLRTLDQLTDFLAVKMTDVAGYRVVPRNQLRQRLRDEKSQGYKKCYDEGCQIELGRAVAAQKSLSTRLIQVGSRCALTASVFDLKSETTERAASVETDCTEDSLMEAIEKVASKLAGRR